MNRFHLGNNKKDTGVNIRSNNVSGHIKVELDEFPLKEEETAT